MRTLHRHITCSYVVTFVVTLVVCTFVMCLGILFKINELLARGAAWQGVVGLLLNGIPTILAFTIPLSAMTSSLLVFGRLSSDNEVSAMKSCGISLWQVASRPILLGLFLTSLCVFLNNEVVPGCHYARRSIKAQLGVVTPLDLLEEGRFMDEFPGLTIYIERKKDERLENVRIYDLRTPPLKRLIRARWATVEKKGDQGQDLVINLNEATVNPIAEDMPGSAYFERYPLRVMNALGERRYRKRMDDMSLSELLLAVRYTSGKYPGLHPDDLREKRARLVVETYKRFVLSFSCLAFVMLGIPLGIKAHRRESSVGVGIALLSFFTFYLLIVAAESLARRPGMHASIIIWAPVIACMAIGAVLMNRSN